MFQNFHYPPLINLPLFFFYFFCFLGWFCKIHAAKTQIFGIHWLLSVRIVSLTQSFSLSLSLARARVSFFFFMSVFLQDKIYLNIADDIVGDRAQ